VASEKSVKPPIRRTTSESRAPSQSAASAEGNPRRSAPVPSSGSVRSTGGNALPAADRNAPLRREVVAMQPASKPSGASTPSGSAAELAVSIQG
jgi:hypothetical protein